MQRVFATLCALTAAWVAAAATAQDYPLRMIVGQPPGGTTDILARLVAARLGERLLAQGAESEPGPPDPQSPTGC